MKFGGTSVGSVPALRQVVEIVRSARIDWPRVVVIVSAMNGVTDSLLKGAHEAAAGNETLPAQLAANLPEPVTRARAQQILATLQEAWAADLRKIADQLTASCQAVDPASTDETIERTHAADPLTV